MAEKNVPLVKAVIHLADKTIVKGFLEDSTGTWSDMDSSAGAPLSPTIPSVIESALTSTTSSTMATTR